MALEPNSLKVEVAPTSLANPILDYFLSYWHQKRCGAVMPSRASIRPNDLKVHMGWVILLDALPDYADFRYRLVGSRVTEYFLGDATGRTVREAYADAQAPESFANEVVRLHRAVCRKQVPIHVHGGFGEWKRRVYPNFDALYLPLSDDGHTANKVLNAFIFDYTEYRKSALV